MKKFRELLENLSETISSQALVSNSKEGSTTSHYDVGPSGSKCGTPKGGEDIV
jgi:hypothetical protein